MHTLGLFVPPSSCLFYLVILFFQAGKDAMKEGPGAFNQAAGMEYKKLGGDQTWLNEFSMESETEMSERAIKR